jgi:signal peptidase II
MTPPATSPPGPDDTKTEPSPSSSDDARIDPGTADEEAAPLEPEAKAAPDKPAPESAPGAAPVSPGPAHRPNYVFLAVLALGSLAADLGSKAWATARLTGVNKFGPDRHLVVIPKYLSFDFTRNEGGAWGLLRNQPESIRRPFFLGISVLAIVFIISLYRRLASEQKALKWGLPLVLGGALGNLIDRIRDNSVIDFINVHIPTGGEPYPWPTFNVADVAICVGVGLMAVDMFTSRRRPADATVKADERASQEETAKADQRPSQEEIAKANRRASLEETAKGDRRAPEDADADAPLKTTDAAPAPDALSADAPEAEAPEDEALAEASKPVEKASERT